MITNEQVILFRSIFKGRTDIYARRWEKGEKNGYSPAYQFNWNEFMAFKAKGGRLSDFQNKKPLLLTTEVIHSHLTGLQTIGVYPLLVDNTSYFIAADFDKENWKKDSASFIKTCGEFNIPVYLERSRSGQGAHVWIFFEDRYPSQKSRSIALEVIRKALNLSGFEKEVSFDRLFPNQDYHTNQGFGNLIALPLNGKSLEQGNTAFLDVNSFEIIPDQWEYLTKVEKVSTAKLDELYQKIVKNSEINIQTPDLKHLSRKLEFILSGSIKIQKSKLMPKLVNYLRENLNFYNTEYLVKEKIGISTYQTEKYFKLITEETEFVQIPRGFLSHLVAFCQENKITYIVADNRKLLKAVPFSSKIKLYNFQKTLLEGITDKESGVIVAPPGSGKTILALELVARKGQPALILVHRKQLLDQWMERIQSFLGINKKEIGQVSGSKKKIGKQITIAMMQSLVRIKNLEELSGQFGMIIVDECQHIPAKTFRELIVKFNPYYLYGLTATPKRKYNDEKLIYYYIGEIITQPVEQRQPQTQTSAPLLSRPQTVLNIRTTELSVPFEYKTDTFELISKILVFDTNRNKKIVQDILSELKNGKRILVLTERKEHVEVLNLYLKGQCEVITLTGEDSPKRRRIKMEQINLGHFQVLLATGQLFGEGMDIPILDCLFLVYPFSFEGKLIQYIGRIQRSNSQQIIYDYYDSNIPFFEKLFKKRKAYYKKRGWIGK